MQRPTSAGIVSAILFAGMLGSLFMPFYEHWIGARNIQAFYIIGTYDFPEVGAIAIVNGFGSTFALFNLALCFVMTILLLIRRMHISVPIVIVCLFCVSQLLLNIGNSAGWGAPFGDTMREGYWIFSGCEIGLIVLSFLLPARRREKQQTELLDDF
jgi:hypothetical protein